MMSLGSAAAKNGPTNAPAMPATMSGTAMWRETLPSR